MRHSFFSLLALLVIVQMASGAPLPSPDPQSPSDSPSPSESPSSGDPIELYGTNKENYEDKLHPEVIDDIWKNDEFARRAANENYVTPAERDKRNALSDRILKERIREAMANAKDYKPIDYGAPLPEPYGAEPKNGDEPTAFNASPVLNAFGLGGAATAGVLATGKVAQQFGGQFADNIMGMAE